MLQKEDFGKRALHFLQDIDLYIGLYIGLYDLLQIRFVPLIILTVSSNGFKKYM